MGSSDPILLDVRGLVKSFKGRRVVDGVHFTVQPGEVVGLLGPNGAGKSSMLNVISGFYVPQEGEVWFRGAKRPPMKPYQVAGQGIARRG